MQLILSAFLPNDRHPRWSSGSCVGEGNHVDGLILLSTSLIGEDADLQTQCSSICTSHQIPANWIDSTNPTYASGLKTGCELIYGVGWPDRGCYLHTPAKVGMANGAPQRFCQLLIDLLFLARRRAMQKLVFVTRQEMEMRMSPMREPPFGSMEEEIAATRWMHQCARWPRYQCCLSVSLCYEMGREIL